MNSPERRETCSLWGNFHVLETEAALHVVRKGREEDTPTTSRTGKFSEGHFCLFTVLDQSMWRTSCNTWMKTNLFQEFIRTKTDAHAMLLVLRILRTQSILYRTMQMSSVQMWKTMGILQYFYHQHATRLCYIRHMERHAEKQKTDM